MLQYYLTEANILLVRIIYTLNKIISLICIKYIACIELIVHFTKIKVLTCFKLIYLFSKTLRVEKIYFSKVNSVLIKLIKKL